MLAGRASICTAPGARCYDSPPLTEAALVLPFLQVPLPVAAWPVPDTLEPDHSQASGCKKIQSQAAAAQP